MKRSTILLPALLGSLLAGPALAAPGGAIDTIQRGEYHCELPGDATGPAGLPVPDENFEIVSGSSYLARQGGGAYLLVGHMLTMTSGPKRGQKFNRLSNSFLRKLEANGAESALRCVRRSANAG